MSGSGPPPAPLPLWHPAAFIATWFGSGLLPIAPGTWGSLAALPFAWVIASVWGQWALFVAGAIALAAGTWAADMFARRNQQEDPPAVVIDEVAGQWLALAVVPPGALPYALGFVLFRLFDIVKPWPAGLIDRRLRNGLGIMLDDVVAGVYAAVALLVVMEFV